MRGTLGVRLDLRAQPPHVDVDRPGAAPVVRSPDALQQLPPRVRATGMAASSASSPNSLGRRWTAASPRRSSWAARSSSRSSATGSAVATGRSRLGAGLQPAEAAGELLAARRRREGVVEAARQRGQARARRPRAATRWTARSRARRRRSPATASSVPIARRRLAADDDPRSFREQDVAEAARIGGRPDRGAGHQARQVGRGPVGRQDEPRRPLATGRRPGAGG